MMTLEIKVNGELLHQWTVKRIKGQDHEKCDYEVNGDRHVNHYPQNGAITLARQVIKLSPLRKARK